ncbi:OsmC family peroxiredoxin [Metallosphaera hakonensis JCM 8857 = DSM 7519]|uniref:Osmotically inducible protein OsmC n=1 Tax=Metallosphaera hakonensis JCM 8857 = DSM 7519 TaxID=1293036 RepID=A0A2U9IW20_9CREN|nr:OsmC family peroxiredoxin [Metallosphaera hakonensis JCM 8857 = DSM 7519]
MRVNNIDQDSVKDLRKKVEENGSIPMERVIEGEFRLEGSPMFVAEMRTETTKVVVTADEPKVLGGQGVHGTPLSYVLFGILACFASTLAIVASDKGISLGKLRVTGRIQYDLAPVVTESDSKIISKVIIDVGSDKNLESVLPIAVKRCPALYLTINPIPVEVRQVQQG